MPSSSNSNGAILFFVSPPIGQALAGDALERSRGALLIVNAERGAVVVAEVKLAAIALQVRFGSAVR